ncbi:MAG: GWxTD domain-containing protein, partial [Clostridiales bacterium]
MIYITRFTLLILVLFISQSFAQVQGPAVNSYYESGIELLKQRDYESAEKQFKKSIDLHADAPSMYQLAKILAEQNTIQSRERARELLKKAIWKEPKNTEYRFLLASLIEKFSLRMALDEYEKITRIDSTSAVAWYNLGRLKEKDFNEYHNSIFLDNADSPPLSYEQFAMADFKEAETYFIKALRFDSLNLQTYLHLSFLYEDVDSSAKGIPLLKKMVRLYPDNEDAHLYLGLLYYKTSNIALAFREYQAALKLMTYDQEMDFTFKSVKSLLEPVLDEQFKKYSDDELKDLIELYWKVNDPLELTQYNERLLEHYSRVAYANLRFGNSKNKIPGWQTDKGEVVLRYGEPLHRLRYRPHINAGGRTEVMVKTDVWQYRDMTLGFTDEYMSGNYRFSVPSPGSRYITQFPGDTQMLMDYLRKARFENYEPRYEGPSFETPYEIVQFKDLDDSKGNKTSVYVNYALSIPDSIIRGRKLSYAHDLGLFYKDRNFDNIFAKKDSVKTLGGSNRITTSTGDELYVNSIDMTVPPDSGILSFEIVRK